MIPKRTGDRVKTDRRDGQMLARLHRAGELRDLCGQGRYREITSTSNTTDFQSRRLEIRFRRAGTLEPVHTLNGTAITARAMIAILENFQEADGSIAIPNALWEFGAPRKMGSSQRSEM